MNEQIKACDHNFVYLRQFTEESTWHNFVAYDIFFCSKCQEKDRRRIMNMPRKPAEIDYAPPAKEEEVPDINTIEDFTKTEKTQIKAWVNESSELGAAIKEATALRKPITEKLKKLLGLKKVGKFAVDEKRVSYFNSPRSKLNKNKLILFLVGKGVKASLVDAAIESATEISNCYTLKITGHGEEDEGEE